MDAFISSGDNGMWASVAAKWQPSSENEFGQMGTLEILATKK
jgi:hypothetical protein